MVFPRLILAFALASWPAMAFTAVTDQVMVEPARTSIYVGHVTLTTTAFQREDGVYATDYRAKVFPYFFLSERGKLWITVSDEQLQRLAKGERVAFSGHAKTSSGEPRRVEGHADPVGADSTTGKIKVRVFVSPKMELIFNTTYRFSGKTSESTSVR